MNVYVYVVDTLTIPNIMCVCVCVIIDHFLWIHEDNSIQHYLSVTVCIVMENGISIDIDWIY